MNVIFLLSDIPAPPAIIILCVLIFLGTAYASYKN